MALTIEDGTGVAGANSYASVAEARAYASARGLSLPAVDADLEKLLVKAADFIESLEDRFQGTRTQASQPLAFPRALVFLFDATEEIGDDVIPTILKNAQSQLAFDGQENDLQPTGAGREVIREKVDVLEVEYNPQGDNCIAPVFTKAMSILQPLFDNSSGFVLRTRRI